MITRNGSHWGVGILLLLCIVGATILWTIRTSSRPDAPFNLPYVLGSGLGLWLFSGLIPLIWLAFRKFRAADGSGPFNLWWGLALVMFIMNLITATYEANLLH